MAFLSNGSETTAQVFKRLRMHRYLAHRCMQTCRCVRCCLGPVYGVAIVCQKLQCLCTHTPLDTQTYAESCVIWTNCSPCSLYGASSGQGRLLAAFFFFFLLFFVAEMLYRAPWFLSQAVGSREEKAGVKGLINHDSSGKYLSGEVWNRLNQPFFYYSA